MATKALLKGIAKTLVEDDAIDQAFIAEHTVGFADYEAHLRSLDWEELERESGISQEAMQKVVRTCARGERKVITC